MQSQATATRKRVDTLEPLSPEETRRIINRARAQYQAMGRYDPDQADEIAACLFLDLVRPWIGTPIVLGRACGISPAALWKWRTRRAAVHVDTVTRICDRLARMIVRPLALAEEAANLMAGIPWVGKKSGSELLRYAVAHGLTAHAFFQLARRQERLNASQYARSLNVHDELLIRLSARPECDWRHGVSRGSSRVVSLARQLGLTGDEIAQFTVMVRNGAVVVPRTQRELAQVFREGVRAESRGAFLRRFLSLLRERHGSRSYSELAHAVVDVIASSGGQDAGDALRLEIRLSNITKPTHTAVWLRPVWAGGIAALAFPAKEETGLRRALIRYLVGSRTRKTTATE
jgi:hypothetical protein